jgi:hypothetical protein
MVWLFVPEKFNKVQETIHLFLISFVNLYLMSVFATGAQNIVQEKKRWLFLIFYDSPNFKALFIKG